MKLTKFLYDFLVKDEYNWELDDYSEYPFEVKEEDYKDVLETKYGYKRYITLDYKADKWVLDHGIEVVKEEITDFDLEKAYVTKNIVFKYDNKFYTFDYDYSYNWDDDYPIGRELREVFPKEIIVTVYNINE